MKKLENFLNKYLSPVAIFMNNSMFFGSLSEAFMRITPITLGAAVLMIIGNFPVVSWVDWLKEIGIYDEFVAAQGATLNALSLFIAFNFAYIYVKKTAYNPLSAGLLSVASFMILMPQFYQIPVLEKTVSEFPAEAVVTGSNTLQAFSINYTGGTGLIVAIMVAWFVALLYVLFNKKNLVVKLPDSVPPNVAESLSPSILSGIIFAIIFIIRLLFRFAPFFNQYGNIFAFISTLIQTPLQNFMSSPISLIVIFMLANLLWFFGIHPNMIYGVIMPIMAANNLANQNAYVAGETLPFLLMTVLGLALGNAFGGQGSTYGLVIAMTRARSARYKELFKLSVIPSIFNINEPLIFGMPIMMNPVFFFPMVLVPLVMGITAWLLTVILDLSKLNPMIQLPWTTPGIIVTAFQGGVKYAIIGVALIIVSTLVWYPFFKVADNNAFAAEQKEQG